MSVPGYAQGIQMSFLATMNERAHEARLANAGSTVQTVAITPSAATTQTVSQNSFLDDVLDVINPLQHIPVVSTLYRAATGDKIGDLERVAGDTLYGGLMGLGSSIANLVFKDVTGKDFGDTALAWLGIGDSAANPTAVADAAAPATKIAEATKAPTPITPSAVTPAQATMVAGSDALAVALNAKGIDPALGLRAMAAYQKTLAPNGDSSLALQP